MEQARARASAAVSAVLLVVTVASAEVEKKEIHACPDAQGEVVYQDEPCLEAPPKPPPKPSPAPSPKSAPTPAAAVRGPRPSTVRPSAPVARPASSTPSPRLVKVRDAAAEQVWRAFLAALSGGDRATARACLTSSALREWGPKIDTLPADSLKEAAGSWARYEFEGDLGPYYGVRALRANARPSWIFLERTTSGGWKIAAI